MFASGGYQIVCASKDGEVDNFLVSLRSKDSLIRELRGHVAKKFGVENLGFLTLTFKENMRDKKEAQRRWNNLNRTISRDQKFTVLVKVLEVQKRGAFHYHLLVKTNEDIREGFDWEAFKRAGEAYQAKDREEGKKWITVRTKYNYQNNSNVHVLKKKRFGLLICCVLYFVHHVFHF